jgi:integrase
VLATPEANTLVRDLIGPDLKRYNGPRPFDSKMLAEGWLAREREMIMLSDSGGQRWVSPVERRTRAAVRGETVESYAKRWIENRNLAPRTRKLYADLLAKHIAGSLGEIGIGALSSDDVNRWHAKTLTDKPTARTHAYSLLHAVCASAVEQELLSKNPCAIKRAMSKNRKREPVLLSVAELKAVADAMRPEPFKTLVLLSAWGALRFGEVTELRRKDFSDGCSVVTVSRAVTHHGQCVVKAPKSGKTQNRCPASAHQSGYQASSRYLR